MVKQYTVRIYDDVGRPAGRFEFQAKSDLEAQLMAFRLLRNQMRELWCGQRRLARFERELTEAETLTPTAAPVPQTAPPPRTRFG